MDCDLILDGGTILDGTGGEATPGAVAVRGGRIVAVGDARDLQAAETIDCRGKVVAPGFIDMHSHSDWVIPQPDHGAVLAPLLEQGITTIVGGNCGCSPAPYLPGNRAPAAAGRPHAARPRPRLRLERHGRASSATLDAARAGAEPRAAGRPRHGARRREGQRRPTPATPDEIAADGRPGARRARRGRHRPVHRPRLRARRVRRPRRAGRHHRAAAASAAASTPRTRAATSRSAASTIPTQQPSNLLALDETAAVWPRPRRPGAALAPDLRRRHAPGRPPIASSSTSIALADEGVDIACDAFPYVGGNTTLVVFMPPWTLTNLRDAVTDPEQRQRVAGDAQLGAAAPRHALGGHADPLGAEARARRTTRA